MKAKMLIILFVLLFLFTVSCGNKAVDYDLTSSEMASTHLSDEISSKLESFENSKDSSSALDNFESETSSQVTSSKTSSKDASSKTSASKTVSSKDSSFASASSVTVSSKTKDEPENKIVISAGDAQNAAASYLESVGRERDKTSGIYMLGNPGDATLINNRYYYVFAHFANDPSMFAVDAETSAVYSHEFPGNKLTLLK